MLLGIFASSARPAEKTSDLKEHPNAIGQVSARLLAYMLKMGVDRRTMISDTVLGTSVRGNAKTNGRIVPELAASAENGLVQLVFRGTTDSPRLVGQNGPATIYSAASSTFEVRKNIILEADGLRMQPAVAEVKSRVQIQKVSARRRFIERIARRRADRSQSAAQAETSKRTGRRLQQEVDRDAKGMLVQANDYFVNSVRMPFSQRDALPKIFQFSSTADFLRLATLHCGRTEFAPPSNVPQFGAEHDIAVALHESSVKSIYEIFYAGKTSSDHEMLQTVHLLTGEDPRPLRVHARTPRWSMTWADRTPLDLKLADGIGTFTVNLKSFTQGDREFSAGYSISASFRLDKTVRGPKLTRIGEVQIAADPTQYSGRDRDEAIAILEHKFSAIFPAELTFDGLTPPTGGIWDKVGALQLTHFEAEDGWMKIAYQIPEPRTIVSR
jgi:hypothetical protein